ncbi:ATP-dependent serine protease [Dysgonomonas sp. ZJ279]|uniref:ATP-dependent serine protease n=1 Tax=Dysgonomonas sp. ZJ279 TaxID=2709796 RepID=UPI0013EA3ED2|nr:ATP-dependent serine protease [Dysgonomonas sp. ZJ279]
MQQPKKTKRALSVSDILNFKPVLLDFEGAWLNSIGKPEATGAWLIFGNTGNGKTRLAMQLARYLTRFGKVAYDSLEEGLTASMQRAIIDVGMRDVGNNFVLLDKEPITALRERLKKKRTAPKFVFIDSVQYTGLTIKAYKELINDFPAVQFIFISWADGQLPKGALANAIYYDSFVHIRVEGFCGIITKSRYGGGADYIVWDKGYREYWKM